VGSPARQPVIVGASVAGALTALRLADAGLKCSIFELRNHPHAKVCGEGFHPAGRRALEEVLGDVSGLGRPLCGFRFTSAAKELIALSHPGQHRGLGCDRLLLEERLWRELAAHPRIAFERGCAVDDITRDEAGWTVATRSGAVPASHVVAADGVRSRLRIRAGRARRRPSGRWGLRQRFRLSDPPPDEVEICFLDEGEVFVTPLAADRVSVAVLGEESLVRRLREPDQLTAFLERMHGGCRLGAKRAESPAQIMPHVGQRAGPWCRDRLYLAGDAAAYLDPISGAGMTLAALSARAVAGAITSALTDRVDDVRVEAIAEREMRRCVRPFRHMTQFLLLMATSSWFRAPAIGVLRRSPRLLRAIASPTLRVGGSSLPTENKPDKRPPNRDRGERAC
jgi:2-polyprenyl-6-methoxyphenol hydroxylase-like FAD-dependent oxidoreductase